MIYVKQSSGCASVSKNYDSDISNLKTKTAVYITQSSTSGNWYFRKWSDNTIELWLAASLTYNISSLIDSGILPDIKIATSDLKLPFGIVNGAVSVSLRWGYTEWAQAHFIDATNLRIRRFGNTNTNRIKEQFTTIYIIGKLA